MDNIDRIKATDTHPVSFERNLLTIAKGGGIVFAGKLFLSFSRLITVILLARILGTEQYGLYNLALSAANVVLGIAILGLDSALVRYVAIYSSRRDEAGLWGAIQISLGLSTLLSVITSTGLFALAYPISRQVFQRPELAPLLQIASLIVPFLVLSDVLAGATIGFKQMHFMVIAQHFAQPIIRFILIVLLSLTGLNAMWAIITFGLADGAASILLLFFLNKQFSLRRSIRVDKREVRALVNFSIPLWLTNMLITLRNNAQTILLGSLSTISSVGIYGVVSQVNVVGQMLYTSITASTRPMIAELHDRGDYEQLSRLYQMTTKWVIMINLPWFLIMVLFPVPILSIFGKSFVNGANALIILACANLVNIGTGMCGSIVDMTGHTRLKFLNTVIRLILFVSMNFLLIPLWGIIGAAFAALAVEIIVNLIILLEIWILFRLLPYNKTFFNPLIAGLAAFATAFTVNQLLPVQEKIFFTILSLIMMLMVYIVVTLKLGLTPEDRLVLSRVQRRIFSLNLR
jgi:O-antigen/teichoic acid export membrane protein